MFSSLASVTYKLANGATFVGKIDSSTGDAAPRRLTEPVGRNCFQRFRLGYGFTEYLRAGSALVALDSRSVLINVNVLGWSGHASLP